MSNDVTFLALFLTCIGTWRLSLMLTYEDGPYNLFLWLRKWLTENREKSITYLTLSDLFSCLYCMSIWVGGLFSAFYAPNFQAWVLYTLLCSTVAIFINKVHDFLDTKIG